jgi:predicted Fe-S protein YdhL (DUF1289 family)
MRTQINIVTRQDAQSKNSRALFSALLYKEGSMDSPCIKVCKLQNNVCVGCKRTQDEIREWFYADDKRKQQILNRIHNDKYTVHTS